MRYLQIACAFFWLSSRFACAQVGSIDFETQVLPILEEHCVACHGADVQESKLRLDSLVDALRGGDSGEAVIRPGNSSQSHLIERVTSSDKRLQMPPDAEPLESADVELLRRWIDDSQQWSAAQAVLAEEKPQHWSFQAVRRPEIPKSECEHPIDSFVEHRLRAAGLAMSATAEKRRLIRRLYLVMHGLPPTPEQISAFVDDTSEDSWSRLVDSVLESPRYGERFASLWLDLVRFGETNGYETNRERPNAYPYRDWVIAAFNDDKPYDQFVREQIAGDALGEPVGTGFLVAGPNDIVKGQDALLGLMQRQDELADMVNATGTAFLGLTTGCARCHNHKFDPISQADYYAMQAVFAGVEHAEREVPLSADVQMQVKENAKRIARMRTALAKHSKSAGIREPVNAVENFEMFEPTEARFLRFTIDDTSGGEPCIDELQVFVGDENVALASAGAKASSSGDFVHPFHKLEHLIDGQFGNGRSWIASKRAGVWAQVEFARPVSIERVVWGRDRERKFADRLATAYRIELSLDGDEWKEVASSKDRRPVKHVETSIDNFELRGLSPEEADAVRAEVARLRAAEEDQRRLVSSS